MYGYYYSKMSPLLPRASADELLISWQVRVFEEDGRLSTVTRMPV